MNTDCNGDFQSRAKYRCFWDGTIVNVPVGRKICPHCRRKIDAITKRPKAKGAKASNLECYYQKTKQRQSYADLRVVDSPLLKKMIKDGDINKGK